jgi:hypothetical protein
MRAFGSCPALSAYRSASVANVTHCCEYRQAAGVAALNVDLPHGRLSKYRPNLMFLRSDQQSAYLIRHGGWAMLRIITKNTFDAVAGLTIIAAVFYLAAITHS